MIYFSIFVGKIAIFLSRVAGLGSGSTWPGHIALKIRPNFLKEITKNSKLKIVLIAGTNGKTTTATMIARVLEKNNKRVFQNKSGANLKNGLVSSFIEHSDWAGRINYEYAVFEVDENNLPPIIDDITPHAILILNLFRDQLDRYGELDSIAAKWKLAFKNLPAQTHLILNADDPLIASLGQNTRAGIIFFGLNEQTENKIQQHASDSIYCPLCKTKLTYTRIYYSHLGHWECPNCKFQRPEPSLTKIACSLPGTYNQYNALAAGLFLLQEGIQQGEIENVLKNITAVFGRQEKINYNGKNIQIFLSKNPTSFNQSIATIFSEIKPRTHNFLFVLNDDIPDGRDISWIWDVDFEDYADNFSNIGISGYRAYDLALRLQYAQNGYHALGPGYRIEPDLGKAINDALEKTPRGETLYILPTYSAMLQVRKILTGRKIL